MDKDAKLRLALGTLFREGSFDPAIDGEDLQTIADEFHGGDLDAAEAASDLEPVPYCDACDRAIEICVCPKASHIMTREELAEAAGPKPPVSDKCDDCGADIDACGCKNMAMADGMEPGPELRQLLELFAQEVYQKRLEELTYEELAGLRDALVDKQKEQTVHHISAETYQDTDPCVCGHAWVDHYDDEGISKPQQFPLACRHTFSQACGCMKFVLNDGPNDEQMQQIEERWLETV